MKRIMLMAAGCFVLSIACVAALYSLSTDIRETPGSFLRQLPPHPVLERASLQLSHTNYYLAGATDSTVYLADRIHPFHVLAIRHELHDTTAIKLRLNDTDSIPYFRIRVVVDSPHFYFMDGAVPYYYSGSTLTWSATNILNGSVYFTDAAPMPSGSFGMRTVSARTQESVLGKKILADTTARLHYTLLQKQGTGIFSTDGDLQYNKALNRFVYLYYYRNEYFVMDTSLNLIYRAHTIDTFSIAHVPTDTLSSGNMISLSAPPMIINKRFTMSGRFLFVHSLAPARNENISRFRKAAVMDVYDMSEKKYVLSFYLPYPHGAALSGLMATDTRLYALFGNTLKQYDLAHAVFRSRPENKKH